MFNAIARPFGILLMFLYELVNNYALALFLVAVVVKVLLLPFQMKGKRGMMRQTRLQPRIAELQKRHAANKQKLNEEMAKLYKEEGVNPASGCLWNFIQMPIMIALFFAIRQPLTIMMGVARELLDEGGAIYLKLQEMGFESNLGPGMEQIDQAQFITAHFNIFAPLSDHLQRISFTLGNINLAVTPEWQIWNFPWDDSAVLIPMLVLFMFPLLSGGAQFVSAAIMRKMNASGTPEAGGTMGNIIKFMPLMSVWFGFILPAALSFYWTIGTILQIGQDIWLTKKYTKILDAEEADRAVIRQAKEADLEAKRIETEQKKAEGITERNTNTSKRKKKKSTKQDQIEKAAEWEKKNAPAPVEVPNEPSRVGNRRYARGRAYDPERFTKDTVDLTGEPVEIIDDIDNLENEQSPANAYEYSGEDVDYTEELYDDDDDDDDDDEYEEDDDEYEDDDEDDEYEDDDDDEDDKDSSESEKFETKRFD